MTFNKFNNKYQCPTKNVEIFAGFGWHGVYEGFARVVYAPRYDFCGIDNGEGVSGASWGQGCRIFEESVASDALGAARAGECYTVTVCRIHFAGSQKRRSGLIWWWHDLTSMYVTNNVSKCKWYLSKTKHLTRILRHSLHFVNVYWKSLI